MSGFNMREAGQGQAGHDETVHLMEMFRAVLATVQPEPGANELSIAMTAACTFAGTMFGTLIVAGVATDQDKRRVTEAMMRNFRSGIDIGKRKALDVAARQFGGSA